jgi:hypothetical protein
MKVGEIPTQQASTRPPPLQPYDTACRMQRKQVGHSGGTPECKQMASEYQSFRTSPHLKTSAREQPRMAKMFQSFRCSPGSLTQHLVHFGGS